MSCLWMGLSYDAVGLTVAGAAGEGSSGVTDDPLTALVGGGERLRFWTVVGRDRSNKGCGVDVAVTVLLRVRPRRMERVCSASESASGVVGVSSLMFCFRRVAGRSVGVSDLREKAD